MTIPAPVTRTVLAAAAIACGGLMLAACGSSSGGGAASTPHDKTVTVTPSLPPAPPATGSSSSPASGPPACATSALSVKLGQGNGAAGSTYVPIVFTNTGSSACSLFGYPGVSFVTGTNGSQVGLAAQRDSTTPAQLVSLAPGGTAHATLQIVDAQNFPSATCKITSVSTLKVFPPNQTAALFATLPGTKTCSSNTTADQVLDIQTVQPGNGAA
jgi:hypothetical protein